MALPTRCRRTVVIVDDDEDIRETLRDFLEDRGFRVAVAKDGAEALHLLDDVEACLILLDLVMPGMDGWAFLRARENHATALRVPVCISTSAPDKAPSGFPVIPKPVDITTVLDVISQYC